MIEPWLNVEQIAKHLKVSETTIHRMLKRRTIPAHRVGKLWRFKASEVDLKIFKMKVKNEKSFL